MANVWDVYTVGDVSFVHEVFLGVSHIFYGKGDNVFLQVYMIGMLLGFIWIFIESMIQQKPIALGRLFIAFIIYSALFVPQATVHLEDSQTKKFYTMDHIPLGLAAGASIVSKIGMGLTRTFEDFFTPIGGAGSGCSPTQMTCTGYLGSLNKIVQLRNNLSSKPAFMALDRALCGYSIETPPLATDEPVACNIEKSITNYVKDCSTNKFLANPNLISKMRGFSDFRYPNLSLNTEVYLSKEGGQTYDCQEAFNRIDAALTNHQAALEQLSLHSEWITNTPHNHTGGGDDTARMATGAGINHNQLTEILAQMTGTSGTTPDAYAYIKNVMFREPIEQGLVNGFISAGDTRAALMIKSAKDQRNIQWAAEENMWISTAKAMATFFEGFVVSLVCLIPFVMFMGGLNIMIEYLKVLMWVQLWNPVMAICNLYIQTVASQKVKDAIANSPITDLYVIDSVEEVAQHWIAVGGLMAATTPLLALFILKGSVYTFTTLASRMSGGDHVNEKMVSPDVMQHAPMLNNSTGAWNADTAKGVRGVGTDANFATISGEMMAQAMESSSISDVGKKSRNYQRAVGDAVSQIRSGGKQQEAGESFCKTLQSQNVQAYNWLRNHAIEQLKSNGWTTSDGEVWMRQGATQHLSSTIFDWGVHFQADVKGKAKNKSGSVEGTAGVATQAGFTHNEGTVNTDTDSTSNSHSAAVNDAATSANKDSAGYGLSGGEAYSDSIAQAINSSIKDVFSDTSNQNLSDSVTDSYAQMKESQESHTQTDQRAKNIKAVKSMDSGQWARQYMDDAKYDDFMQNKLNEYERKMLRQELESGGYLTGKTGTQKDIDKAALLEWAVMSKRNDEFTDKFWDHFGFGSLNPNQVDPGKFAGKNTVTDNDKKTVAGKGQNIRDPNLGRIKASQQTTSDKHNALGNEAKERNAQTQANLAAMQQEEEAKEQDAMNKEAHRRQVLAAVFRNEGGKANKDLVLFDKRQVGMLPLGQHADYLNYARSQLSGNGIMNSKAAAFGLQYMEDNIHAWCSDKSFTPIGRSSENTSFEKNDVWFDRMMKQKPEDFNAAIDEIGRNLGLSRKEAEDVMRALPTMMRGTYIEYEGLNRAYKTYKDQNPVIKANSSKIEAVLKGTGNGDMQDQAYAIFGSIDPQLKNFYAVNVRGMFHDYGYSYVSAKPGRTQENYLDKTFENLRNGKGSK